MPVRIGPLFFARESCNKNGSAPPAITARSRGQIGGDFGLAPFLFDPVKSFIFVNFSLGSASYI